MKSLKSSLPLDKDSSLDIWGGNSIVGFGENTTLFCHVSRVLFSAQISHAWGHLLWKREFRMPTWKGKRTLECWNTSDCRYRHWTQEHSQSSSREGTPEILFADVWDIHCPLAQYWHIGLLHWWARVPPSVQGKKNPFLLDNQLRSTQDFGSSAGPLPRPTLLPAPLCCGGAHGLGGKQSEFKSHICCPGTRILSKSPPFFQSFLPYL